MNSKRTYLVSFEGISGNIFEKILIKQPRGNSRRTVSRYSSSSLWMDLREILSKILGENSDEALVQISEKIESFRGKLRNFSKIFKKLMRH